MKQKNFKKMPPRSRSSSSSGGGGGDVTVFVDQKFMNPIKADIF
jgi:hypothetical protein